jgi:tetratricopeptide (TPR) repeat protein
MRINGITFPVISFLFLFICLFSCKKQTTGDILADAGQYMQTRLDTVNLILDQITNPEQLEGSQQARYCWMKARCCGYLLGNWKMADSLSRIVLNYSRQSNEIDILTRELSFIGHANMNLGRIDEALSFLTEFTILASDFNNRDDLFYGNSLISECYFRWKNYNKALQYSKSALGFLNPEDTLRIADCNKYIARIYIEKGRTDSAMVYYSKALDYLIPIGNIRVGTIFDEIAKLKLSEKDYRKAIDYVELSLENRSNRGEIAVFNLTKARIFMAMNELDSAHVYLRRTIDSSEDNHVAIIAYRYLSDLYEIFENNEDAYYQTLNLRSVFRKQENILNTEILKNQYQKLVLQNEIIELKLAKREREIYLLTILFSIFVVLIILWFIFLKERKKKRLQEQLLRERYFEDQARFAEKENQFLRQENELIQLREKASVMRETLFRKMSVSGKIPSLDNAFTPVKDSNRRINLDPDDWDELIQTVNDAYSGFVSRLKKEYPDLSVEDIGFCCLLKINVSMQDLADIYCISKAGITKKKTRMKKDKFKIENESFNLDHFLSAF